MRTNAQCGLKRCKATNPSQEPRASQSKQANIEVNILTDSWIRSKSQQRLDAAHVAIWKVEIKKCNPVVLAQSGPLRWNDKETTG